ncbi:MAG: GGDEF domain-containing protein [Planctomycetaceae bacterium]
MAFFSHAVCGTTYISDGWRMSLAGAAERGLCDSAEGCYCRLKDEVSVEAILDKLPMPVLLASSDFIWGALSAVALLVVGTLLGLWFSRRVSPVAGSPTESQQVVQLLSKLSNWTNGFATDMSHIKQVIDEASSEMKHLSNQPPDRASQLLSQVAAANELLQKRIADAEQTLADQTEQLESYMNEARTDALTGLPNRRAFDDELLRRMAEWQRHDIPFLMLVLDVDHFKRINDTYGHPAGDSTLKQLAAVLKATLRQTDSAYRFGGEEFVVAIPGQGEKIATDAAERLRITVRNTEFMFNGTRLPVTISVGVAQPQRNDQASQLFKRADEALYAAKQGGRNCCYMHDGQQTVRLSPPDRSSTPLSALAPAPVAKAEVAPASVAAATEPTAKPAEPAVTLTPVVTATTAEAVANSEAGLQDEPATTRDFAQVCADLRKRLKEVMAN